MDDDELVRRVRHGDVQAFGALYERHRALARRVAIRVAGTQDADDVVGECWAALLGQLVRGREIRDVRSYLLTSVRHEAARRRAAARRCEPRDDLEPLLEPVEPVDHGCVVAALRALPARWRHVLWLVEVQGSPPREAAADLGLSPNAVAALACRARAGLRRAFEESRAA